MFLGLAQTTVLAAGPALKQEERKSPFKAERAERAGTNAQRHAFWGVWHWPRPRTLSEGWGAALWYLGLPTKGLPGVLWIV